MGSRPLVSIGLPVCNGALTLGRALDSLLAQTYSNLELIISDNSSTDDTSGICHAYAKRDNRVRYIRQSENIGVERNFLFVAQKAQGEYFMWAADDDQWDKEFAATLVRGLEAHPECGVAMSSFERRYPDGALKDKIILTDDLDLTRQGYRRIFKIMMWGVPIHMYIYGLFRREFLQRLLRRSIPPGINAERTLLCEAALATHFYSTPIILFFKTKDRRSPEIKLAEDSKYANDPVRAAFLDPMAWTKYHFTFLIWILTSPLVPVQRKLFIPFLWLGFVWNQRKTIAAECLHALRKHV